MTNNEEKALDRCCNSCPFLVENADKPNPNGWVAGEGKQDWYTQKNLDRLWKDGLSYGEGMVCHSHDDEAADYGGNSAKEGVKKLCHGAVMMQYKHLKVWESQIGEPAQKPNKIYQAYKTLVGKIAMKRDGLQTFAYAMAIGRYNLFGGPPIPRGSIESRPMRNITGSKIDINTIKLTPNAKPAETSAE